MCSRVPPKLFVKDTLWYCWWKKSQTTTWDGAKTPVNHGMNYQAQLVRRISEPSVVSQWHNGFIAGLDLHWSRLDGRVRTERHPQKKCRNGNGKIAVQKGSAKWTFFFWLFYKGQCFAIVLQVYQSCYKNPTLRLSHGSQWCGGILVDIRSKSTKQRPCWTVITESISCCHHGNGWMAELESIFAWF